MPQTKITDIEIPTHQKLERVVLILAPGDRFSKLHAAEYARDELDYGLSESNINNAVEEPGDGVANEDTCHGIMVIADDDGLGEAVKGCEKLDVDDVIVSDLRSISPMRDLAEFVRAITDNGTVLHSVEDKITINSGSSEHRLIEIAADMEQESARPEFVADGAEHHGRAPLGYTVKNGRLVKGDNYDEVMFTLVDVKAERLSQNKAANRLDTSRATIKRCIEERPEMYRLDE